ncbi:ABC transporter ATP-binding protein [Nocardioides insulae]|uniref:ABC transporter ATP-binding protein n=1 Tax=Nocardioides insulae TaxID=394734 RepID=UPI0004284737|nr:ABC transporter ATP-binding protein [Nocardioides insulae]
MRRWWQRLAAWLRPERDEAPFVAHATGLTLAEVFRRFWPRMRPLRWWLLLSLCLLAIIPLIEIAEILLFQRLVDDVLVPAAGGEPLALLWATLLVLAVGYVGLNLLSGLVSAFDDYLATWISQRFLVDLRRDVFAHVLALPSHVHDHRRLGDVLSRLTTDIATVERFMVGHLTAGLGAVIRLVLLVGALFWLQWELALASLLAAPALALVSSRFARFAKDVSRERRRRGGSLASVTEESLANATLMQVYGAQDDAVAGYHRQNRAIADAELSGSKVRGVFLPLVDLIELAGILLVVGMGVWALSTDRLTLGGLLAFMTLLVQCYRPVQELSDLLPSLFSATAGIERVVELLDQEPPGDVPDARPLVVRGGEIRFEGVRATYPGGPRPALSGLDLLIPAGAAVAVTGASGSGKSTLVRLLTRQLAPDRGRVLIDDQDLAERTACSVRDQVSVVMQETLLLDASVRANIALARPDATEAEVRTAARTADADDFVTGLPEGYDTRVGQRGRLISGGQRQRLALARALLRGAPVMVLDEPTTGLDDAAAERFLQALLRVADGTHRTVLVMTHDPRVLPYVDRVVALGDLLAPSEPAGTATEPAP